jgi:hypothetical protein
VAIVDEKLAHRLWPNRDPLGRRLLVEGAWLDVVGVVHGGKYTSVWEAPRGGGVSAALAGAAAICHADRSHVGPPAGAATRVEQAIPAVDPEVSIDDVRGDDRASEQRSAFFPSRLGAWITRRRCCRRGEPRASILWRH